MRIGFYFKLAWDGIRKNLKLYLPYMLTCVMMIATFYIMTYLEASPMMETIVGGSSIATMLGLGVYVIGFFALVFLFYTNSFLVKQRKREFGLYNFLGMSKRNLSQVLFLEALIIAAITLALGIGLGVLFSKLFELVLVNLLHGEVTYDLRVNWPGILLTIEMFCGIFGLIFINSVLQVSLTKPIELLKSANVGEKPPKANWLLGIAGICLLGGAYFMAVSIDEPLAALETFLVAVLMVIIATYLLMIAGSVLFIKFLQKRKGFYYKPNHFVSVSSMAYRMKRNGAGLASICILATMVLVTISSTACLFFGVNDAVNDRYPRDVDMYVSFSDDCSEEELTQLKDGIAQVLSDYNVSPVDSYSLRTLMFYAYYDGEVVETNLMDENVQNKMTDLSTYQFLFIPLSEYNAVTGTQETLQDGEALVYSNRNNLNGETLNITQGTELRVKRHLDDFLKLGVMETNITPSILVVVNDPVEALGDFRDFVYPDGSKPVRMTWIYDFNITPALDYDRSLELNKSLDAYLDEFSQTNDMGIFGWNAEVKEVEKQSFYSLYGGVFYIGVILSFVFGTVAVLIIYYKQISEGYEDQGRFEIMQEVGMTKGAIRRSINTQLLMVFFLPLMLAVLHLAFAFPLVDKLLNLFQFTNTGLFISTTLVSSIVFAFFYTVVYKLTSNVYYNIVSKTRKGRV